MIAVFLFIAIPIVCWALCKEGYKPFQLIWPIMFLVFAICIAMAAFGL